MQDENFNNEKKVLRDKGIFTAEMLKKHFDKTRQRKYDLPRVFAFLEESLLKDYYITPNFDIKDYEDFGRDFDRLLDSIFDTKVKNMIIEKFGLFGNKPMTYSEIALKNNCSLNKIYANINSAISKISENTYYLDNVKKHFNLRLKNVDNKTENENIEYILNIMKELEKDETND